VLGTKNEIGRLSWRPHSFHFKRSAQCWHLTDKPPAPEFVAYWTNNGQKAVLGLDLSAAIDPLATLAVHRGNGFDAGFSPYQSTRLSRYNAVS
jgi:hypothetical protein